MRTSAARKSRTGLTGRRLLLLPLALTISLPMTRDGPEATAAASYRCHGEPATFVGTPGPDHVTYETLLYERRPVLVMRGGDDVVDLDPLHAPTLSVCAGSGNDSVSLSEGGHGHTRLAWVDGGKGGDHLLAARYPGNTQLNVPPMTLRGGGGDDRLRAGLEPDRLVGGGGADVLRGLFGDDRLLGGGGNDRVFGLGGDDRLFGARGSDLLDGGQAPSSGGFDRADGGPDDDRCLAERVTRCESRD